MCPSAMEQEFKMQMSIYCSSIIRPACKNLASDGLLRCRKFISFIELRSFVSNRSFSFHRPALEVAGDTQICLVSISLLLVSADNCAIPWGSQSSSPELGTDGSDVDLDEIFWKTCPQHRQRWSVFSIDIVEQALPVYPIERVDAIRLGESRSWRH